MVITGVADRMSDRLAKLVYLDADVPLNGQSEFDLLSPEESAEYEEAARSRGDGWRIPPPFPDPMPPGTPAVVAWAVERMVPQPLRTLTHALHLTRTEGAGLPRTYVLCTEGKEGHPDPPYVERVSKDPGWRVIELHAGHSAHVTAPHALADTLIEVAKT
jgi:hypothetical protein